MEYAAEFAFVDQLLGQHDGRAAAIIVPNHVRHFCLLDGGDHFLGFLGVQPERLLAEDHLAGLRRGDGNLGVEIVRGANINQVDILPRDQFSPIGFD